MFLLHGNTETLLYHIWECHFVKTVWIRLKVTFSNELHFFFNYNFSFFNINEGE